MVDNKGQAAMEFIMTYGWAILLVITAIGALAYFGILNPSRFLPNNCILFTGLACNDFIVSPSTIDLVIRNGYGKELTIVNMNVIDDIDGSNCVLDVDNQVITDGGSKTFSLGQCSNGDLGSKFRGRIQMSYIFKGGSLQHLINGEIISKVEAPVTASCVGNLCTATPIFSYEEDNDPYWGYILLSSRDNNFITSIDEGIVSPDNVVIGFPTLNINTGATISNPILTLNHREDMTGCYPFGVGHDIKHEVSCYNGASWQRIGLYNTYGSFTDDTYNLAACVVDAYSANNVIVKVSFDPPDTVCGKMEIDFAQIDIGI